MGAVMTCRRCRLALTRTRLVAPRGPADAPLLVIGEGPGGSEDILGEAFVGPAGRLLDDILAEAGYRGPVRMLNVVWCHPTDKVRGENRAPAPDEVLACAAHVHAALGRATVRAVILAGDTAARYYARRVVQPWLRMLHPAALLREGGVAAPAYDRVVRSVRLFLHQREMV